jgi:sugar/nucleoside kinase (ribokinase family)
MTILVLGDANADLSARMQRFPAEGDDAAITALGWASGGAGVNVATALAVLAEPVRLLACVGADPAAEVALRGPRRAGVDLGSVQVATAHPTGLCFAAVSPGGERTFFSFRGANSALALANPAAVLEGVRWLHLCGHALLEGPQRGAALALLEGATARGVPASLDLCLPLIHARRVELAGLLACLHTLFVNELELAALGSGVFATQSTEDTEGLFEGYRQHLQGGVSSSKVLSCEPSVSSVASSVRRVVKLGARGCRIEHADGAFDVPGFAVDAVDTTGCGDAFAAAYIRACLAGATPVECARFGNALGALVATRAGAAEALPTRAELRAFLHEWQVDGLAARRL